MADRQLTIDAERIKADQARAVRRAEEAAELQRLSERSEATAFEPLSPQCA
jgi:hypothetical protein